MEKIIIKNFLIFDDLEMEVKRLNVLIGEQASGKSLLAKLVYFFKTAIRGQLIQSVIKEKSIVDFHVAVQEVFLDYFPSKFWDNKKSEIEYRFNAIDFVNLKFSDDNNMNDGSSNLVFELFSSKNLVSMYDDCQNILKKHKEAYREEKNSDKFNLFNFNLDVELRGLIYNKVEEYKIFDSKVNFIPANRSLFSIFEGNSFSLLSNNYVSIDSFFKEFGELFQYTKNFNNYFSEINEVDKISKMDLYSTKVLKGRYVHKNNEDWLIGDNYQVTVSKASSGQQEAFPLMTMLYAMGKEGTRLSFDFMFVEEPEAHLFPKAQNTIVSALLYLLNQHNNTYPIQKGHSFFITTHSPYILSAINNAILADDVIQKGKLTIEEYVELSDGAYPISFDDVSAYSMEAGNITDIKDKDYRMIGGEILDSVSNEFGEIMDKLLDLDNE